MLNTTSIQQKQCKFDVTRYSPYSDLAYYAKIHMCSSPVPFRSTMIRSSIPQESSPTPRGSFIFWIRACYFHTKTNITKYFLYIKKGFELVDDHKCLDTNECTQDGQPICVGPVPESGHCINTPRGFKCICMSGKSGVLFNITYNMIFENMIRNYMI